MLGTATPCERKKMDKTHPFTERLLAWFENYKRDLPWRNTNDAYKIWLSEIILQQTRVAQGMPYYQRFVENYPTVQDLANAPETEVLRLWQGLGYYSRARNMHATAKIIVSDYDGVFPQTAIQLQKLKGIGKYTAAAIASFAFGEPVPVIDGNVYRVLSRLFAIQTDIASPKAYQIFEQIAYELLPNRQPAAFNQAIMEFGAIQCTPQNPTCITCIFFTDCKARLYGKQAHFPVKSKNVKLKTRYFHYFIFQYQDTMLMKERTENDIWKGLYDFPLWETSAETSIENILTTLTDQYGIFTFDAVSPKYQKHQLTHQTIWVRFVQLAIKELAVFKAILAKTNAQPYADEQIKKLPKPILIASFLEKNL